MNFEKTRALAKGIMTFDSVYHKWCYENGCAARAMWMAGTACRDEEIKDWVIRYTNTYVMPDGEIPTYPKETCNIDMLCYGAILPVLYEATGDERYKKAALTLLSQFDIQPRTKEGGFWHKQIYPGQMWLDGLYMGMPFMARMAAFTGKHELYDDVVRQFTLCFEHTLDESCGLCRHAWDSEKAQPWADKVTGQSPNVWGRAMGWFTVAHADVLSEFPKEHPGYKKLLGQLNALAEGIARWQRDGLWYQVMNMPGEKDNYQESSCSAMFAYALAKGVKNGLLDKKYLDTADTAFDALFDKKVTWDDSSLPHLQDICRVAGLGGAPYGDKNYRDGSYAYYMREERCADDYKGYAPLLMAASVLEK